jgi:hypothetical protein
MMKKTYLLITAAMLIGGCVTSSVQKSLYVSVDAYSIVKGIGGNSFFITPHPSNKVDNLQFVEYSSHLRDALLSIGLNDYQNRFGDADLAIIMSYGTLPPLSSTTKKLRPIFGQTGGGMSTYSGTVWTPNGPRSSSGTAYYSPAYGVVGYHTVESETIAYGGAIRVSAMDWKNRTEDRVIPIWSCTIIYSSFYPIGEREALPLAIKAALPYFGSNPGRTIDVQVPLNTQ